MATKKKKKKSTASSGKKLSMRERMKQKKEELAKKGGGFDLIFLKEGTIRVRALKVDDEMEFVTEVIYYYLGKAVGSFISPATFGEPCAFYDKYQELKTEDSDDESLIKRLVPKKKQVMLVAKYKDLKGKELDERDSPKLVLMSNGLAQEVVDYYLDEDEWGDMTDPKDGYDLKLTREGTGMTDTNYSATPCKPSKGPKGFNKTFDLKEFIQKALPTYEETVSKLEQFMGDDSDEEDEKPKKKRKKSSGKKRKKSKDLE